MISAVLCRLWQARKEKEQRAQLLMEEGKQKLEAKEFAIAEKTFASGKLGRISKSQVVMLLLTHGQVVIMTLKSEIVRLVVDSSGAVLGARPHGAAEAAARGQEQESRRGTCSRRRDIPQARGLDKGFGQVQGGGEEGPQERRSVQHCGSTVPL